MPAIKDLHLQGNAREVIEAVGKVAAQLAESNGMEQETKQIVIPAVFGMVKIEAKAEID